MSTWKSSVITAKSDQGLDWVGVVCWWQYQSVSDVFTYTEVAKENSDYINIKKGNELKHFCADYSEANRLYHALANFLKRYNKDSDLTDALNNNMFERQKRDWDKYFDQEIKGEDKMALETLKGVKEINNHKIIVMDELRENYPEKFNESGAMDYKWFESEIRPNYHIYVRHDVNSLSFTVQNGPIKENGHNGVQIDDMIDTCRVILEGLNKKFPCRENAVAITKLQEATMWLRERKREREERGVEGQNKA